NAASLSTGPPSFRPLRPPRDVLGVAVVSRQALGVAGVLAAREAPHQLPQALRQADAAEAGQDHAGDFRLLGSLVDAPALLRVQRVAELAKGGTHDRLEVGGRAAVAGPAEAQVVAVARVPRPRPLRTPRQPVVHFAIDEVAQPGTRRRALRQPAAVGRQE